jgi:flavin reductase (DIM6/NTAB) family NADH-FMN oxidoreductase RutF
MLGDSLFDNLERDVYIATTEFNGELGGQVITWVTHASLVPGKRNVISIFSKFNHTYKLLTESKKYILNLPSKDQTDLTCHFGLKSGNNLNKFSNEIEFQKIDNLPILKNTAGYAFLKVMKEFDLGDRVIVISRVESECFLKEIPPLKLRHFLNICSSENIAIQKNNYEFMIKRDMEYIKDEF